MKSKIFSESKQVVFNSCMTALSQIGCTIKSNNFQKGTIDASKTGSLLSYGHKLNISIHTTENHKVKVMVTSTSLGIQIIDWGTNSSNEEELISFLIAMLK